MSGFRDLKSLDAEEQRQLIEGLAQETNKKLVDIIQPIRVALSGKTVTPGIFEVISIIGRADVEKRLERAIASIDTHANL
ncbi:MAG: Glutamate--tRNA ligase [Syntrophorhabdus sp. PtaU1.Bin050]|nr:MAG: Glutamate--tRNA ligase [Syntrophorhabdus sp. PtaU1.Bin050]